MCDFSGCDVLLFVQVLCLHNCTKLSAAGCLAIASACPKLSMLLLGGSTLEPCLAGERQPQRQELLQDVADAAPSSLHVIGVVEEGFYIPAGGGSGSAHSSLQMLRDAVESGGAGLTSAGTTSRAGQVARLCTLARSLHCLRVLELTHFTTAVVEGVRQALQTGVAPASV
jgi:hypothetical protein